MKNNANDVTRKQTDKFRMWGISQEQLVSSTSGRSYCGGGMGELNIYCTQILLKKKKKKKLGALLYSQHSRGRGKRIMNLRSTWATQ
jgi:hypothetical protein